MENHTLLILETQDFKILEHSEISAKPNSPYIGIPRVGVLGSFYASSTSEILTLGEPVASGVYFFYTLTAGEFTATRKMLIRK